MLISPAQHYNNGYQAHSMRMFEDAEQSFEMGTKALMAIIGIGAIITFGYTQPNLNNDPVVTVGGYYNVCIAIDYYPASYLAAVGYQVTQACWWWSAFRFCSRAKVARDSKLIGDKMLWLVRFSAVLFCLFTPMLMICIMVKPDLADPVTVRVHLYAFEAMIFGAGQWFFMQWLLSIVLARHSPRFRTFTFWVWLFVICSIVKIHLHHNALALHLHHHHGHDAGDLRSHFPPPEDPLSNATGNFSSPAQILDLLWLLGMFCITKWHVFEGYDPLASGHDADRRFARRAPWNTFAPYITVPPEKEDEIRKHAAELGDLFKTAWAREYQEDPRGDENWGMTLGLLKAKFKIDNDIRLLHPDLRTGLFEKEAEYDAVVRFNVVSQGACRMSLRVDLSELDKSKFLKHELAEDGSRPSNTSQSPTSESLPLRQTEEEAEIPLVADFMFAEALKEFFISSAPQLTAMMKFQYRPEGWSCIRWFLHTLWYLPWLLKFKSLIDKQFIRTCWDGRMPSSGLFGKEYYGALPFRIGKGACKWGLIPRQDHDLGQGQLTSIVKKGNDNATWAATMDWAGGRYTQSAQDKLQTEDMTFDFCVQIATSDKHNLSDTGAIWPEDLSPYLGVGQLIIEKGQKLIPDAAEAKRLNGMTFSVWNNLKEHQPIGVLNNVRHNVYKCHSEARFKDTGAARCPAFPYPKPMP